MKEFSPMNIITKKTILGTTGVAAAALMVGGFAAPAMADTSHESTSTWTTTSTSLFESLDRIVALGDVSNSSPIVVAPEVSTGDVLSGDVTAPVASGNETSAGNGNSTGNGTSAGNGTDVSNSVDDIVDSVTDVDVSDIVDDVTGDLGLDDILN
jgi:hypothetical protein